MIIENKKASFTGKLYSKCIKFVTSHFYKDVGETIANCYEPYVYGKWKAPRSYKNELIELLNCKGFLLTKSDGNHSKVIYQLHGGAYIGAYSDRYNKNALYLSNANDKSDVFSLDYRVADVSPFPAALDDAYEGYKWLLIEGYKPENIVITGDSAGGGLSLALTLKLRDLGEPLPKCLLLCSPWTDLTQEGDSYYSNRKNDPMFGSNKPENEKRRMLPVKYAKEEELSNPFVSPVFADYKNMPPMQIQVGLAEMLLSDSTSVYETAVAAGVDVELITYKGMYHTFYCAQKIFAEQKEAWKRIEEYLHK